MKSYWLAILRLQMKQTLLRTAFVGICLNAVMGCTMATEHLKSDHYDGKKFFNPTLKNQFSPGIKDVFSMMREGRQAWPKQMPNSAVPALQEDIKDDEMAITFVNHATFLIQLPGINILTDPVWSERVSPVNWFGPKRVRAPGVDLEALPKIDLVLISHNHYDHLDLDTIKKLNMRFSPHFLVPLGDSELLKQNGVESVDEMDWWNTKIIHPEIEITFAPTQHSSGRGLLDRDRSLWGSYFIKGSSRSVYFGGDGGYSTHFSDIKKRIGSPDVAMLGIGAYEPRSFMKPIHTNPAEAVQAHKDMGAKISIGMHHGTFQLSSEGYDQPQNDLLRALFENRDLQGEFIMLAEGQTMVWKGP